MFFRKIDCPRARGWFSEYLDGRLKRARALEEHLEGCPQCREELDSLSQVVSLLRAWPQEAPPRSFALSRDMVARQPQPRGTSWAWGLAASAAALLLAFFLAGDLAGFLPQGTAVAPTPSPTPPPSLQALGEALRAEAPIKEAPGPEVERAGGWPLTQIEYALAGLTFVLAAGIAFSTWRRRGRRRFQKPT